MQAYLYYVIHVLYSSIAAIYTASRAVVWLDDFINNQWVETGGHKTRQVMYAIQHTYKYCHEDNKGTKQNYFKLLQN